MHRHTPALLAVALVLACACEDGSADTDSGTPPADAGPVESDAGPGPVDAGADAGAVDAGADAGIGDDAATPAFALTSSAFAEGEPIPVTPYACNATDFGVAMPLAWSGAPAGAMSFALLMDDPDAGGFVHWVAFDIPAATTSFAMGEVPAGVIEGRNDFGELGYAGPCPPSGTGTHHYRFRLFALDVATVGLAAGATLTDVETAVAGHTLAEATLTGTVEGMF